MYALGALCYIFGLSQYSNFIAAVFVAIPSIVLILNFTKDNDSGIETFSDMPKPPETAYPTSLELSEFNISELTAYANAVAESLNVKYPGVDFELQCNSNPSDMLWSDFDRISMVINNLLQNAIKYSHISSKPQKNVTLLVEFSDGILEMKVSDNGIGIPDDQLQNIFERHTQGKNNLAKHESFGLGLYILKQAVQDLKGDVTVESTIGNGSTFKVTIPESAKKPSPILDSLNENITTGLDIITGLMNIQDQLQANTTKVIQRKNGKNYKIMVVDDDVNNLDLMGRSLAAQEGYSVTTHSAGNNAILALQDNFIPDLLLLDLMMPNISGDDILRYVRCRDNIKDMPIVLISAKSAKMEIISGLELGADDYLVKPMTIDYLLDRVAMTLNRFYGGKDEICLASRDKTTYSRFINFDYIHPSWDEVAFSLWEPRLKKNIIRTRTITALETYDSKLGQVIKSSNLNNILMVICQLNIPESLFSEIWEKIMELSEDKLSDLSKVMIESLEIGMP